LEETQKTFDDTEHKAKEKLPNVDYKSANTLKIRRKRNAGDGDAPNADGTLSSRDKFRVKSFIPIMDALETSLKRRSIIYENFANNCFVFSASEEQLNENVRFLMKYYPEDVDINLTGETKH
jgi:hypothetical protein